MTVVSPRRKAAVSLSFARLHILNAAGHLQPDPAAQCLVAALAALLGDLERLQRRLGEPEEAR